MGASTSAVAPPAITNPFNVNVIAALQTDLLNTLEPKHRDADGQIDIRALQKVFVKAVNASLGDQDPAYIAAALCLGSEEELLPPDKFADDAAVAAFCERALRKRLEEQQQQEGKSADAAADNSDPPVTAPPVHPAFMDRGDASKADREGLFHSFKEINDIHALGGFRFILAEWLVEQAENADATGFKMPAGQHVPPEALHRGKICLLYTSPSPRD